MDGNKDNNQRTERDNSLKEAFVMQPSEDSGTATGRRRRRADRYGNEDNINSQMTQPVKPVQDKRQDEDSSHAAAGNATEDILAERLARVLKETRKQPQSEPYRSRQLGNESQTGYPTSRVTQAGSASAASDGKSVPLRTGTTGTVPPYSAAAQKNTVYSSPENQYRRMPPANPYQDDDEDDDSVFGKKLKQQYEDDESEEKRGNGAKKIILIIVIVVLAVAAALVIFKLIPDDSQGFPGEIKRNITSLIEKSVSRDGEGPGGKVLAFSLAGYGKDAERASVQFSVTTAKDVTDIRLTDENGKPLEGEIDKLENAEEIIWKVTLFLDDGYKGKVSLQARSGNGEWEAAGKELDIEVAVPTAVPKATDTSSQSPAQVLAQEKTSSPTPVPTVDMNILGKSSGSKVQIVPISSSASDSGQALEDEAPEEELAYIEPGENEQEETEAEEEPSAEISDETENRPENGSDSEKPEEPAYPGDKSTVLISAQVQSTPLPVNAEGQRDEKAAAVRAEVSTSPVSAATKPPAAMFVDDEDIPTENSGEPEEKEEETDTGTEVRTGGQTEDRAPDLSGSLLFPKLEAHAAEGAEPSVLTSTVYEDKKTLKEYNRSADRIVQMPKVGQYTKTPMGVLTFRNDAFRQNAASGTVEAADNLTQVWAVDAGLAKGADKTYYGIGWTGQPVIVKWSKEVREQSNMKEEKIAKSGLKEVIIAGLDGNIYFLDLSDGSETRPPIKLGYPMKGTPSLHPNGSPLLTVGQFARKMKSGIGKIGLRTYNLYDQKEMKLIDGLDGTMRRGSNQVGSFETSALIDRTTDTLVTAGTNGLLYVIDLNSAFDYKNGTYSMNPTMIVAKSRAAKETDKQTAVESSVAMYDHYVFYADMAGILRCVDTTTMQPVWAVNLGDSVESAIALDFNDSDGLNLYAANILNNRKSGNVTVRCFDAMTGAEKWQREVSVKKDTSAEKAVVGFRASPVIGQDGLQDLIFYTVTGLTEEGCYSINVDSQCVSALIAMDKNTGEIKWSYGMPARTESSPVAVYDAAGNGRIIQCCSNGDIYLLDGLTGGNISVLHVDGVIDASPAVYNDMMVVGTTGKGKSHIYGIQIS